MAWNHPPCGFPTHTGAPCQRPASKFRLDGTPACSLHLEPGRAAWPKYVWTADRLERLEQLRAQGLADGAIASRLGTTTAAVQLAAKRHGVQPHRALCLTARAVARLLGIPCSKTVSRWIEQGWLRGRRTYTQGVHRVWLVRWDDLEAFLADPDHWVRWAPERITHAYLRRYVAKVRGDVRYLTHAEVAAICGVERGTVSSWIVKGWLPAERNGNWRVRDDDLAEFRRHWAYGDGWREEQAA